jgi:hypothetical protein
MLMRFDGRTAIVAGASAGHHPLAGECGARVFASTCLSTSRYRDRSGEHTSRSDKFEQAQVAPAASPRPAQRRSPCARRQNAH